MKCLMSGYVVGAELSGEGERWTMAARLNDGVVVIKGMWKTFAAMLEGELEK